MKDRLIQLLTQQKVFLSCWFILIMILSISLIMVDKASLHIALNNGFDIGAGNGLHTTFGDMFFKYFTKIAEYLPYIVVIALLFYSYRWAIVGALGQLGASLTTQIIKHIVNAQRPKTFFENNYPDLIPQLHWVDGVNLHSWMSFPSGHTTAFFAMFFLLSLMTDKKWLQTLYFFLAVLGGYSRIYLSQHFTSDVLAGCIIGVVLTSIFYIMPWPHNQSWADKSLKDIISLHHQKNHAAQ